MSGSDVAPIPPQAGGPSLIIAAVSLCALDRDHHHNVRQRAPPLTYSVRATVSAASVSNPAPGYMLQAALCVTTPSDQCPYDVKHKQIQSRLPNDRGDSPMSGPNPPRLPVVYILSPTDRSCTGRILRDRVANPTSISDGNL